ncbi:hypothetical protein GGI07_002020 [Coemansia sp. Benny D115]|nr:hypothetical protein GGI07_002020 [Coemansia sp. Benny D115]
MIQFYIKHQLVSLDINFDDRVVKGVTELTVIPKIHGLSTIWLHCERPVVRNVSINGVQCAFRRTAPKNRRDLLRNIISQKNGDSGKSDVPDTANLEITIPSEIRASIMPETSTNSLSDSASSAEATVPLPLEEIKYAPMKMRIEFYIVKPSSGLIFTDTAENTQTVHTESRSHPGTTRLWVPCLDDIHERCTWELIFIVPACTGSIASGVLPLTVISSGELSSLVVHPRDPGKRIFRYMMSTAIPASTLGFAIGPFTSACTLDGSLLSNGEDSGDANKDASVPDGTDSQDKDANSNANASTDANSNKMTGTEADGSANGGRGGDDDPESPPMSPSDKRDGDNNDDEDDQDGQSQQVPLSATEPSPGAAEGQATEAKTSHNSKLRKATVDAIGGIFAFTYPGMQEELEATCSFIPEALAFHSQEFGSYPYQTYKVVFMEGLHTPVVTCASLTLISVEFLHPRNVVEPVYETRRCLGLAISEQWFGTYIIAETWSDYWLIAGLAGYVSGLFVRHNLGHNEYRYRLKRDMTRMCHADVNQRPISYSEQGPFLRAEDKEFVRLKGAIVLHMLDRRMMKGGMSLGLHRIVPKILVAAISGDLGASNSVGTTWFLKMCRKVSGVDLKTFVDQWIYGTGCPVFHFSYAFNRKKLAVEITMHQESTNSKATSPWAKAQLFSGQMTARIREADGTPYEHVLDIHEATKKFEVQFNTKYKRIRRSTKRFHKRQIEAAEAELNVNVEVLGIGDDDEAYSNIALFGAEDEDEKREWRVVEWGEDDEESLASATFEWIRIDPDLEWASVIHFEQPDFMWAAQLQKDRDVAAQLEAVDALQYLPSSAASTTLMRTVMDGRVFYRVRVDAALALAHLAKANLDWIGLHHLAKIYANRYCIESDSNQLLPKPNNFTNVGEYFTQKAVLAALSNIRDQFGEAPAQARSLMLAALRYNDNSENVYSDCYFLSSLVRALASAAGGSTRFARVFSLSVEPSGDASVLSEIERLRKLDMLVPSFHNVITGACLDALLRLSLTQPQEYLFNTALFFSMAGPDTYVGVRETAVGGLLLHWGIGENAVANRFFIGMSLDTECPRLAATTSRYVVEAMLLRAMAFGRQHNSLLFREEAGKEATEHIDTDARLVGGLETFIDTLEDSADLQTLIASAMYDTQVPPRVRELMAAVHALVYHTADCSMPPRPPTMRKKLKIKIAAPSRKFHSNASSDSEDMPLALGVDRPPSDPYSADNIPGGELSATDIPLADALLNPGRRKWQRTPSFSDTPSSTSGLPQIAGTRPPPIAVPDTRMNSPAYAGSSSTGATPATLPSIPPASASATAASTVQPAEPTKVKLKLKLSKAALPPSGSVANTSMFLSSVSPGSSYHSTLPRVSSPLAASSAMSPSHGRNTPSAWSPAYNPPDVSGASYGFSEAPTEHLLTDVAKTPVGPSSVRSASVRASPQPQQAPPQPSAGSSLASPQSANTAKLMLRVLRKISKHPSAFPFLRPVDVVLDGCPTYYEVIKNPMDLGTIKQKLEARKYTSPAEFDEDMRLMLNNCYVFNPPGTPVYVMGQEVEAAYESEWAKAGLAANTTPVSNFAVPAGSPPQKKRKNGSVSASSLASPSNASTGAQTSRDYSEAAPDSTPVSSKRSKKHTAVLSDAAGIGSPSSHTLRTVDSPTTASAVAATSSSSSLLSKSKSRNKNTESASSSSPATVSTTPVGKARSGSAKKSSGGIKLKLSSISSKSASLLSMDDPDAIMEYLDSQEAPSAAAAVAVSSKKGTLQPSAKPEPPVVPSGGSWKSACVRIMLQIQALPCSLEFMAPVDPIKQGVPTYLEVVKHPMDLGTIRKKLDRSQYRSPSQFVEDIKLVFSNCFLFNTAGTYVYSQGEALQSAFESVWKQQFGTKPDDPLPAALPDDIPVVDKALDRARTILGKLKKDDNAWPFLKPVDPIAFGVPTYFDIVKNPMDLSTVQKKLSRKSYASVADFVADVRLIFDDCVLFNPPDTPVHDCGQNLRAAAAKLFEPDGWSKWF